MGGCNPGISSEGFDSLRKMEKQSQELKINQKEEDVEECERGNGKRLPQGEKGNIIVGIPLHIACTLLGKLLLPTEWEDSVSIGK